MFYLTKKFEHRLRENQVFRVIIHLDQMAKKDLHYVVWKEGKYFVAYKQASQKMNSTKTF